MNIKYPVGWSVASRRADVERLFSVFQCVPGTKCPKYVNTLTSREIFVHLSILAFYTLKDSFFYLLQRGGTVCNKTTTHFKSNEQISPFSSSLCHLRRPCAVDLIKGNSPLCSNCR